MYEGMHFTDLKVSCLAFMKVFLFSESTFNIAFFLAMKTLCRIIEFCIKKRLQWNSCFARKVIKESEYYEEMMRYLRKNLAVCSGLQKVYLLHLFLRLYFKCNVPNLMYVYVFV